METLRSEFTIGGKYSYYSIIYDKSIKEYMDHTPDIAGLPLIIDDIFVVLDGKEEVDYNRDSATVYTLNDKGDKVFVPAPVYLMNLVPFTVADLYRYGMRSYATTE